MQYIVILDRVITALDCIAYGDSYQGVRDFRGDHYDMQHTTLYRITYNKILSMMYSGNINFVNSSRNS